MGPVSTQSPFSLDESQAQASPSALHRPQCLHGPQIFKALGFLLHHTWLFPRQGLLYLLYRPDCFSHSSVMGKRVHWA